MISGHSSLLIADYILMRAAMQDAGMTQFEVIKRVFISHGRHLATFDKPLIIDRIEAWKHGPVIPVLYHELKIYGEKRIPSLRYCGTPTKESSSRRELFNNVLSSTERNVIDDTVKCYLDWTVSEIYQLCHEKGSPWDQCYTGEYGVEIPDYVIKEYYKSEMMTQ